MDRVVSIKCLKLFDVELLSLDDTIHFGQKIASILHRGDILALSGDLGAGKTALARAIIQALTGQNETVPSPSFTLLQQYSSSQDTIWHYDWYRLKSTEEVYDLDFEEALEKGITLVEWPERAPSCIPDNALWCRIAPLQSEERKITIFGDSSWKPRIINLI